MRSLALLALLLGGAAPVQNPGIETPDEVRVPVGRLATFAAKGTGRIVWICLAPEVQIHAPGDGRSVGVCVSKVGRYRIAAVASGEGGITDPRYVDIVGLAGEKEAPEPGKPEPKLKADPAKATVKLRWGNSACTATVIGPRRADGRWWILSAAHCTEGVGSRGKVLLPDGRTLAVEVMARNSSADLSWLLCDEKGMDLPFAVLSAANAKPGAKIWHCGFGDDKPGNRETGEVLAGANDDGKIRMMLSVSPGDSGSGIFSEETGELIAVTCCTSMIRRKASMYGGGAVAARLLKPADVSEQDVAPREMPIVP